jgi:hypothetical protein
MKRLQVETLGTMSFNIFAEATDSPYKNAFYDMYSPIILFELILGGITVQTSFR